MRYASFGTRFMASFLDSILIGIVNLVLGFLMGIPLAGAGANQQEAFVSGLVLGAFSGWLYSAVMESSSQRATFGKMAFGLTVTDLNGNQISFGAVTGRFFGKYVSSIICGAGYIMAAFTEKRQGLHDMMAGCVVLER